MEPIKVITYNIDGLPNTLDLKELPLILRPVAWVYKLFKGTTIITVNDDGYDRHELTTYISDRLLNEDADIIAVQEDFNYHSDLMRFLRITHTCGKYSGGFDLRNIFTSMSWCPIPRFMADGLNVIIKDKRIKILSEDIVRWKKSYGYVNHANDLLAKKGFRLYELLVDGKVVIDVYNVHMDADFYNPDSCPDVTNDVEARQSQLQQLTQYIMERNKTVHRPIVIMGDTNSLPYYAWDVKNIEVNLIGPISKDPFLFIDEPSYNMTADRMFIINDLLSNYEIAPVSSCHCHFTYGNLSDHVPISVELNIKERL